MYRDGLGRTPSYFVELHVRGDRVSSIRDFRYCSSMLREAVIRTSLVATPGRGSD